MLFLIFHKKIFSKKSWVTLFVEKTLFFMLILVTTKTYAINIFLSFESGFLPLL